MKYECTSIHIHVHVPIKFLYECITTLNTELPSVRNRVMCEPQPSTDASAPASSTTAANAVAKDGAKSGDAAQKPPPPPGFQSQNQVTSTKPSAARPAQPGVPKPSASVRPSPASRQAGHGGSATARPVPTRPPKRDQSVAGAAHKSIAVVDKADSPTEQPPASSAMVCTPCFLFRCSVLRVHVQQQSARTNAIAVQNESCASALQAEAAAFASRPLDESKFAHSGYEFLQKDKLRDKYVRIFNK